MSFTPPYPARPTRRLSLLETLRRFRHSQISVWYPGHFYAEFFVTRLFARQLVVCNSPETVHAAFVQNPAALERKTPQMRHALEPLAGDGLIISDGLVWKERRRLVATVSHVSRLGDLSAVMTEAAAERAAAWRGKTGTQVDVLAEMAHMAAEVICRTLFGKTLGTEAAAEVTAAFTRYQSLVAQTDLPSLLGLPAWWPRPPRPRLRAQVRRIHAVVERLVAATLREEAAASARHQAAAQREAAAVATMGGPQDGELATLPNRPASTAEAEPAPLSLIGAMARATLPGGGRLSPEALRNEAVTLFLAGHETTANVMAWAWYLLSQDQAAADRLRQEARTALGGRAATHADLPNLPFTRAVVEETLRLYPPIPLLGREAQQDFVLAGHHVPKGALVLAVPWLLHRHRKYWPQPDEFVPERFLPEAEPPPRHAFIPFSLGPRVCTGAGFALAEAVICLATLAQEFSLALPPGAVVEPLCRLTLRPGETLPMQLETAA